jgi:hypothetical protein
MEGRIRPTYYLDGQNDRVAWDLDQTLNVIVHDLQPWMACVATSRTDRIKIAFTHDGMKLLGKMGGCAAGFKPGADPRCDLYAPTGVFLNANKVLTKASQQARGLVVTDFWIGSDNQEHIEEYLKERFDFFEKLRDKPWVDKNGKEIWLSIALPHDQKAVCALTGGEGGANKCPLCACPPEQRSVAKDWPLLTTTIAASWVSRVAELKEEVGDPSRYYLPKGFGPKSCNLRSEDLEQECTKRGLSKRGTKAKKEKAIRTYCKKYGMLDTDWASLSNERMKELLADSAWCDSYGNETCRICYHQRLAD